MMKSNLDWKKGRRATCGRLRLEGVDHKIGHLITYQDGSLVSTAQWLGHCRIESPRPANSTEVEIIADSYTERGIPFSISPGYKIQAYLITNNNLPQGQGLFIRTRPATKEELLKCPHNRHPLLMKK